MKALFNYVAHLKTIMALSFIDDAWKVITLGPEKLEPASMRHSICIYGYQHRLMVNSETTPRRSGFCCKTTHKLALS
jgi:hypothetical protein